MVTRVAAAAATAVIVGAAATVPDAALTQPADPVNAYLAEVDAGRLAQVATDLVTQFGPRHQSLFRPFVDDQCTPSAAEYPKNNLDMASDYVASAFADMGYPVELETIRLMGGGIGYNVIATKVGTADSGTFIEIGAHIDTVPTTPGAGDNASGATALVEMARVLSSYESGYSLRFIAHVGEESGQTGSNQHLDGVLTRGERIKAGLIMDGIGWSEIAPDRMNCIWHNDEPASKAIAEMFDEVRTDYGLDIAWRACTPSGQTADNKPYWDRGLPAVLSIGGLPYTAPGYHGCGDTIDKLDMQNVMLTTQQNLAVLLRLDAEAETVWRQTDWSGGNGQHVWADPSRYSASNGIDTDTVGRLALARASDGSRLFADDFYRPADVVDPLAPWVVQTGAFTITNGTLSNIVPPNAYALVHNEDVWTDFSVGGRVRIPADGFAACIGGRLNVATGEQYAACLYAGGWLTLLYVQDWDISWEPIAQVSLPEVGDAWHDLLVSFTGDQIRVHYDGTLLLEESNDLYSLGGVSLFTWTRAEQTSAYGAVFDDIVVTSPPEYVSTGTLESSAFDGGDAPVWGTLSWNAAGSSATSVRVRTRTSDQLDHLAATAWADWISETGSAVASADKRWIQYQIEMASGRRTHTPTLRDIAIAYRRGGDAPEPGARQKAFLPHALRRHTSDALWLANGRGD